MTLGGTFQLLSRNLLISIKECAEINGFVFIFRGISYTPPPSLGNTRANEVPLSALAPALSAAAGSAAVGVAGAPSSHVIEAHLAVQATIRSYQVRGHLAAQIDPLNISNLSVDAAKKLIIRSVQVQEQDLDTVFQLPATTWIGGTVRYFYRYFLFWPSEYFLSRFMIFMSE